MSKASPVVVRTKVVNVELLLLLLFFFFYFQLFPTGKLTVFIITRSWDKRDKNILRAQTHDLL